MKLFNFQQDHYDSANNLFKQRQIALIQLQTPADWLENLEQQLLINLQILSYCPQSHGFNNNSDVFIYLASQWFAGEIEQCCKLANQLLLKDLQLKTGIFAALSLLPLKAIQPSLIATYQLHPSLRADLWELWQELGADIPLALVHQAESENQRVAFNALNFAAENPTVNLSLFQNYYLPLITKKESTVKALLYPAIWGGMLRGDPQANIALRIAIELSVDAQQLYQGLYLAALSGDINFIDILRAYTEKHPMQGLHLLSLYGRYEIIPDVLQSLKKINLVHSAATAWRWLWGSVPMISKLQIVDHQDISSGEIPDIESIEILWNQRKHNYQRWLNGNELTITNTLIQAQQWSGQAGRDLQKQLALLIKKPINCGLSLWQFQRKQFFNEFNARHCERSEAIQNIH